MSNAVGWSQNEEASFRELVKKAAAESRLYYSRAQQGYPPIPTAAPPPVYLPVTGEATAHPATTPRPAAAGCLPPAQPLRGLSKMGSALDSESLLLAALLWLLWEEKADSPLLLAILYILFV
ncbi:MAG: hypothetical protein RR276_04750 [Angelakisella sp.]